MLFCLQQRLVAAVPAVRAETVERLSVEVHTYGVIFGVKILLIEKFGLGTLDLGLGTYG